MQLSVVVPLKNEESNVPELYRRLIEVLGKHFPGGQFELLFVDDGSTDRTFFLLEEIARNSGALRVLKLSRNFGHHFAITAGLDRAAGEYVVIMDGDLQDLPEAIPDLYAKATQGDGYDLVYAVREERKHPPLKRAMSHLFNWTFSLLTNISIQRNSSIFRIMSRRFVDELNKLREPDRFLTGLMYWVGMRQTWILVKHGERFAGKTKYSFPKMLSLATQSIVSFSLRPLQIASLLGFSFSFFAFVLGIIIIYRKLILNYGLTGWPSLVVIILFFSGVQLFCIGLLGEYVGRTFMAQKNRPLYVVECELSPPGKMSV